MLIIAMTAIVVSNIVQNSLTFSLLIPGETKHFISGSADNSLRFWDCETATTLSKYETKTAVRACGFSYCGTSIMMTTDRQMGHDCFIFIYDIREGIFTDFVL